MTEFETLSTRLEGDIVRLHGDVIFTGPEANDVLAFWHTAPHYGPRDLTTARGIAWWIAGDSLAALARAA